MTELRRLLAAYREAKDLVEIGAYVAGTNPTVDRAIELKDDIEDFLQQDIQQLADSDDSWSRLGHLVGMAVEIPPRGGDSE
jgi:flagellum-specific ATP synthase